MIARLALLALPLLLGGACHSQSRDTGRPDRREIIEHWSGQHGGDPTAGTRVLRTVEEWNAFWKRVERQPPPAPDFSRHMAVVISLGEKRTGGFGAEVVGARAERQKLIVEYREISPPPGAMVTQALTSPWTAAVIPRSNFPVVTSKAGAPRRQEK